MENYYKLLNNLSEVADKQLLNHPEPTNEKSAILLYSLAKADKTVNAIILLCYNGLGEDALILCRSLFELMITVEYILNDESNYMAKRYLSYDWIQRKEMYNFLKTSSISEDLNKPENIKISQEVEKMATEAKKQYKYNKAWSDKSIYEMAKSLGKMNLYKTIYRIQCGLSHSNPRAMNDYFKEENGQLVLDSGPSINLVEETLVTTFNFYYALLKQFNEFFKKNFNKELKTIEDEFVKKVKLSLQERI